MDSASLSQEQRIAERRQRIDKRMQTLRAGSNNVDANTVLSPARYEVDSRAQQALQVMADERDDVCDAVSQFQLKAAAAESERREADEKLQEEQQKRVEQERKENEVRQGALELSFAALYDHTIPHELHAAIEEQKKQCGEVMAVKDKLMTELQAQLTLKEEQYVRLLRQNADDVNLLVQSMNTKTQAFLDQYTRQLEEVEAAYEEERKAYLKTCSDEILQLVKNRRTKETDYRKRRDVKILEAQGKLEEMYDESYEAYNISKREKVEDNHTLNQELEKCKTDFMLNGERLSYNLQVLRERVKENKSAQAQYKRKLARLQDTLSSLMQRYQESDKKFQRTNKDLTAQLHRADNQYRDMQQKFQLFERADKSKYRQIWKMHDEKCKKSVLRCLQADRVLFEEVLSMPWQPPEMNFWSEQNDAVDDVDDEEDEEDAVAELELDEPALMLLQILQTQAPFLVDENVRSAIQRIEGATEEQAAVEGILTTLKIKKTDDIRDMMEFFVVETGEGPTALINPQEAVRALNAYLEARKAKEESEKRASRKSLTKEKMKSAKYQREKAKAAEENYWKRLADAVPKEHMAVWGELEKGLEQYLAQLQQRKSLVAETDALRNENNELRGLLGQYVNSDINYQLHEPPALFRSTQGGRTM